MNRAPATCRGLFTADDLVRCGPGAVSRSLVTLLPQIEVSRGQDDPLVGHSGLPGARCPRLHRLQVEDVLTGVRVVAPAELSLTSMSSPSTVPSNWLITKRRSGARSVAGVPSAYVGGRNLCGMVDPRLCVLNGAVMRSGVRKPAPLTLSPTKTSKVLGTLSLPLASLAVHDTVVVLPIPSTVPAT